LIVNVYPPGWIVDGTWNGPKESPLNWFAPKWNVSVKPFLPMFLLDPEAPISDHHFTKKNVRQSLLILPFVKSFDRKMNLLHKMKKEERLNMKRSLIALIVGLLLAMFAYLYGIQCMAKHLLMREVRLTVNSGSSMLTMNRTILDAKW